MQIRCSYCQTMFPISREETLAALEHMEANDLKYYDAHCPNCRRANRVERLKLETSYPNWREDLKVMVREAGKAEAKAAAAESKAAAPKSETATVKPAKKTTTASKATAGKKKPASRTSKK